MEWVAIPFFRGSFQAREGTGSSALQADSLLSEPPGKFFFTFSFSWLIYKVVLISAIQHCDSVVIYIHSFLLFSIIVVTY